MADALLLPAAPGALEDLRFHRLPAEPDGVTRGRQHEGHFLAHFHGGIGDRDRFFLPDLRGSPRIRSLALCAARRASGNATWADPAGLVNRATYEELRDEIL